MPPVDLRRGGAEKFATLGFCSVWRTPFATIISLGAGRAKRTIASNKNKTIDKRSLKSCRSLRDGIVPDGVCVFVMMPGCFSITF